MGEEEACPDLKPEEMIKEVREDEDVTLANEDRNKKNHSVQGHWTGRGRIPPSWTRRTRG